MKNTTLKNTIANLASRIWTMIANLLFVPIYIRYLGSSAYGLVTFFATLQTVLNLLGLGLSKTLRREFAKPEDTEKECNDKYKILRSVELIYIIITVAIILICFSGADFISNQWLNIEDLDMNTVIVTIRLMGVSIGLQLMANLYLGCILGLNKQVKANCIQVTWSVFKNVGVIIILMSFKTNIIYFYTWHCLADFLYTVVNRMVVINYLKSKCKLHWTIQDIINLKEIYKFSLGIMIISIGYAINTQVDKLLISNKFTLTIAGAYNTAYNLSYLTTIITSAIGIAAFTRFANLYSSKKYKELKHMYKQVNSCTNVIVSTMGMYIAMFSYEIICIWTGSSEIAEIVRYTASFVVMGTMLNAMQEIPYDYLLASGITIINNIQTLFCIIYVLIFTPIFINLFGVVGAGLAWFVEMFLSTTVYLIVFYKKFYKGEVIKKILREFLAPILFAGLLAFLGHTFIALFTNNNIKIVCIGILFGSITLLLEFLIFNRSFTKELFLKLSRKGENK